MLFLPALDIFGLQFISEGLPACVSEWDHDSVFCPAGDIKRS